MTATTASTSGAAPSTALTSLIDHVARAELLKQGIPRDRWESRLVRNLVIVDLVSFLIAEAGSWALRGGDVTDNLTLFGCHVPYAAVGIAGFPAWLIMLSAMNAYDRSLIGSSPAEYSQRRPSHLRPVHLGVRLGVPGRGDHVSRVVRGVLPAAPGGQPPRPPPRPQAAPPPPHRRARPASGGAGESHVGHRQRDRALPSHAPRRLRGRRRLPTGSSRTRDRAAERRRRAARRARRPDPRPRRPGHRRGRRSAAASCSRPSRSARWPGSSTTPACSS